jgi:hypothetical protein
MCREGGGGGGGGGGTGALLQALFAFYVLYWQERWQSVFYVIFSLLSFAAHGLGGYWVVEGVSEGAEK